MIGIYKITNKITGEAYIGQSTDIHARWQQHRRNAIAKDKVRKYALYRDIRRYGYEVFDFEVLEECKKSELDERENYWILEYGKEYHLYNILHPKGAIRR
jgi:group I intron endonuclease